MEQDFFETVLDENDLREFLDNDCSQKLSQVNHHRLVCFVVLSPSEFAQFRQNEGTVEPFKIDAIVREKIQTVLIAHESGTGEDQSNLVKRLLLRYNISESTYTYFIFAYLKNNDRTIISKLDSDETIMDYYLQSFLPLSDNLLLVAKYSKVISRLDRVQRDLFNLPEAKKAIKHSPVEIASIRSELKKLPKIESITERITVLNNELAVNDFDSFKETSLKEELTLAENQNQMHRALSKQITLLEEYITNSRKLLGNEDNLRSEAKSLKKECQKIEPSISENGLERCLESLSIINTIEVVAATLKPKGKLPKRSEQSLLEKIKTMIPK